MIPVRRGRGSEGVTCALRHQLPPLLCSSHLLLPEPSRVSSLTESCTLASALQATGHPICCWRPEKDRRCNAVNYSASNPQGATQHKQRGTSVLSSLVGCPQRPGWALLPFRTRALSPRMLNVGVTGAEAFPKASTQLCSETGFFIPRPASLHTLNSSSFYHKGP